MFSFVLLCLRFVGSVMFSFVCVSLFCSVVNEYFFACVLSFGASSLVRCRLGNVIRFGVSIPSGYSRCCVRLVMTSRCMPHTSLSGIGHTLW